MVDNTALSFRPMFTTHNFVREGGRKTHIESAGKSLCGLIEREDRFLPTLGEELGSPAQVIAWLDTDLSGEVCTRCARAARALVRVAQGCD
jgi:hypothetical protein